MAVSNSAPEKVSVSPTPKPEITPALIPPTNPIVPGSKFTRPVVPVKTIGAESVASNAIPPLFPTTSEPEPETGPANAMNSVPVPPPTEIVPLLMTVPVKVPLRTSAPRYSRPHRS